MVAWMKLDIEYDEYSLWGPPVLVLSMLVFGVFGRCIRSLAYAQYPREIANFSRSLRSDAQRSRQFADWAVYPGAALNAVILSAYGAAMVAEWYWWSRNRQVNQDKSMWQWLSNPELRSIDHTLDETQEAYIFINRTKQVLWIAAGHFAHDVLMTLDFGFRSNWTNLLHHIISLTMIFFVLSTRILIYQLIAPALIMEASSVPLDVVWCVKQLGMPRLSLALQVMFAISFLLCRTIWWTAVFLWAHGISDPLEQAGILPNVLLATLTLLQLYWTTQIVIKFVKMFTRTSSTSAAAAATATATTTTSTSTPLGHTKIH
jgi:hypothetical protein